MTSTRLLLPGDQPSRTQVWRRWLLHSFPGRILLTGVAIGFLTSRNTKLSAAFGDSAGWAAAAGLLLGAVLTVALLLV